jgi:hypothetical protein
MIGALALVIIRILLYITESEVDEDKDCVVIVLGRPNCRWACSHVIILPKILLARASFARPGRQKMG